MKNLTILTFLLLGTFALFAQSIKPLPSKEVVNLKKDKAINPTNNNGQPGYQKSTKAYGDTIAYEDFSSGGPGVNDLPTGWTSVNASGNNLTWKYVTPATNPGEPFYSTSAPNGWMMLDTSGVGPYWNDVYLYSPVFDCSAYSSVAVAFEEYYLKYNFFIYFYGGIGTSMKVSIDSGSTWTYHECRGGFESQYTQAYPSLKKTENPSYNEVNISDLAAGQSNVMICLHYSFSSDYEYWRVPWLIDDFKLIVGRANNIEITNTYTANFEPWVDFWDLMNYRHFSKIPVSQITPCNFYATVRNKGANMQTNVDLNCIVSKDDSIVFLNHADTTSLGCWKEATLEVSGFVPSGPGEYEVTYIVSQTESDEEPIDNVVGPVKWEISNNKIIARDKIYSCALNPRSVHESIWPATYPVYVFDGDGLGARFPMINTDSAQSVSVFIDYRTDAGTCLAGLVYLFSFYNWDEIGITDELIISEEDIGQWVTIPIYDIYPNTGVEVIGGESYLVEFQFCWDNFELWIGGDDTQGDSFSLYNYIRCGTNWALMSPTPMIRLNLAGAIEPPVFRKAPGSPFPPTMKQLCISDLQAFNNELDFAVVDPQGLQVSIDTINVPDFITDFVDHGNGIYTLAFDFTGVDTSSTVLYNFELVADNGHAQNTLYFNTTVEECSTIEIEEELSVKFEFEISPNPVNDLLNVSFDLLQATNVEISIFSPKGKLIEKTITGQKVAGQQNIQLNTEHWKPGL